MSKILPAPPHPWPMSLLQLRLALRLSLRQAARVADMSHMQVHLLEKGEGTAAARQQLLDSYRVFALHSERLYGRMARACAELERS